MKKIFQLFWEMFKISASVLGGGFAIMAAADEVFSRKLRWTEEGEIIGNLPVFQMAPGITGGHVAVYVGRKIAGIPGAIAALLGVLTPSIVVFSIVAAGYDSIPTGSPWLGAVFTGLRASLSGIIVAMIIRSWKKSIVSFWSYVVLAMALVMLSTRSASSAFLLAFFAIFGVIRQFALTTSRKQVNSTFWTIPLLFMKYGLIAFGGGYVLVPEYVGDFVGPVGAILSIDPSEFSNLMAMTQMTPGPLAVNCATFFGFRMAGVAGAVIASIALVVPGSVLLYLALGSLERFSSSRIVIGILSGVRPVTIAMMAVASWMFLMMSVGSSDGGYEPFAVVIAVFAMISVHRRWFGVVKTIFISAGASVGEYGLLILLKGLLV